VSGFRGLRGGGVDCKVNITFRDEIQLALDDRVMTILRSFMKGWGLRYKIGEDRYWNVLGVGVRNSFLLLG
jgi:hypothetical protein